MYKLSRKLNESNVPTNWKIGILCYIRLSQKNQQYTKVFTR